MTPKKSDHYLFETELQWQEGSKGIISSKLLHDTLQVAPPSPFAGGVEGLWSPEHLLLSAVTSCYMTSYMFFARKAKLKVQDFFCSAIGTVAVVAGKLQFTAIDVYPKIGVEGEADMEKARDLMLTTQEYCLVSNTLQPIVFYHGSVVNAVVLPEQ
jgi:organic hydroperoxide reductase OsmC/OhrA